MRVSLSFRGDYAVRAMLVLGAMDPGALVSARRIAERTQIPTRFVAHVLTDLGRAGLVLSSPGRLGGYRLAAPAAQIDLLQIVDAVDSRDATPRCVLRGGACDAAGRCAVHDAFAGATNAIRSELREARLADLVARNESIEAEGRRPI